MARSKQIARDRQLPQAPGHEAPEHAQGGDRRKAPAMPQADGALTAGGARRMAGAAGNAFVADMVGGGRQGGGRGAAPKGGLQVNAEATVGSNGAQASLQVSGGIQVGGLQIGGNLRVGTGGRSAPDAKANGAAKAAPEAGTRTSNGPALNGGGGGANGRPPATGGGTPSEAGGDDVLAVGGFQMNVGSSTAGGGTPAAPPSGNGAPGGRPSGAPAPSGVPGGGAASPTGSGTPGAAASVATSVTTGTTGAGTTGRTGTGGSSGNAAGGSRAPRGGGAGGGGRAAGGGGGGGGGGKNAPAAPVSIGNTESAQGAMNEFLGGSPTRQAKMWSGVGVAVGVGLQNDGKAAQEAAPELHATMGGGGQQPDADKTKTDVKAGQAKIDDKKISPDAPKVVPVPTVMPAVSRIDGGAPMRGMNAETPVAQKQAAAKSTIKAIPTTMKGVPRSAGPAPGIPLTGASDPGKAEANRVDAEDQAKKGADDLRAAVENGRGPDAVQPLVFDEASKIRELAKTKADASKPVSGVDKFMSMGVSADVEASLDANEQAVMDTALAEARGQMDEAVSTKDTESRSEIDRANVESESLRGKAESEQQAQVARARGDIGDARTSTLVEQEKAVAKLENDAGSRSRQEIDAVHARVAQDEAKIESAYTKAETDVDKKISEGETKAEEKKKKAEEDADDQSWWDRVKSAVADAFKALTDAINAVLDWVRDAVKAILDSVKKLATDLIDAAAKWITDKLKAFGEWLKSAVTLLLGSVFPELAKKLNELIDAAVDFACEKVNQLAETLKQGITALCDAVAGALDAILGAFQAAMNLAVALANAALTGNWAEVGKMVLEAILKLCGIPPEEFYRIIGQGMAVIGTIAENPGGFLGNCLDAVGQGFGQFSGNFVDHLQTGFVSWMTGAMGEVGLDMPESFDLAGVFDIATQVMGITKENLREKAVDRIGEENVERVEFVWGFIDSALQGGMSGLWDHVKDSLGSLKDDVLGAIQDFLVEKVVKSAVLKLASMFNPVGAAVQAILTVYNLVQFFMQRMNQIMGVVTSIIESVSDIAAGNIGGAADMIENALGNLVPVAIDLLAKLLGLGGVSEKVKKVIGGVREKVDGAIDMMLDKVVGLFSGKGKKAKEGESESDEAEADEKAVDEKKDGGVVDGSFAFQTPEHVGRDNTLGMVSFSSAGSGRVKNTKGDLAETDVTRAKSEVMQAVSSAVGKAVNADGVTGITGQLGALSDKARISAARDLAESGLALDALSISSILLPPDVQKALDEVAARSINGKKDAPVGADPSQAAPTIEASPDAKSKYAVAEAPVAWRAQVQGSIPAATVHPDDAGHTYHLLEDGDVVSESKPMLVDTATASKAWTKGGIRRVRPKKQTPEQKLKAHPDIDDEELELMKGALKKNPRAEETLLPDGQSKAVPKPHVVDATGNKLTSDECHDGTVCAPMTNREKDALLKGHALLAEENKQGADMRKVIPHTTVGAVLNGTPSRGAESLGPVVRGSVGMQHNTDGMDAEDTIATLGLDYEHKANKHAKPDAGKKKRGTYTDMDDTGKVTMSDDVEREGLHYIDFKMTKEMEEHAGIAMSQDLIDHGKKSKNAKIAAMSAKGVAQEKTDRDDPFCATGATSSNALKRKSGDSAGLQHDVELNQELNLDPKRRSADPHQQGYELEAGAQMKRRGNRAGEDKVIATLVEKADKDGKIVKQWELDEALEKNERGHYKNKMDHATSDAAAKLQKPGESKDDYKQRMAARDAMIAAQRKKGEDEAKANGNPFVPGSSEFKSYNRAAKKKAAAKSDATESSAPAPSGDTSHAPPASAPKVDFPSAEPAAPARTEAKAAVVTRSSKSAPDTESATDAAVERAKKNDARSPAEEIEKLLSPAARVKPPKESKPPKDFPEPANDTVQGTTATTTTTTTGTAARKVAANPGLRKEHEGTGVDYQEMKGEVFVKAEEDAADIDPNDVKQGSLGDCYLLGGMAAVSRANPEHIRKLIKDNGDGTYDVTLYIKNNAWDSKGAAKVVTVDGKFPSSDKGLSAKYAKAGDKGGKGPELWTMLIEKAWAVHKGTYTGIEGGHVNDDGKFAGAIALLTNLKEGYYTPSSIGDKQLAQMIFDALAKKMPVACDSKNLDKEAADLKAAADTAGVVGNHAYAPKSVDLAGMTIELQNPWGSSHVSGLKIADFKRFYRGLRIGS